MQIQSSTKNNSRIAKNTIILYMRMMFMMLVTLYTSRVVLDALGTVDYGIYNVVGGIVAMLGFLNGAMISSSQRFITFELGRNDQNQLKKVFNTSLIIHISISILIFLILETGGVWFLYNKLNIPVDRIEDSFWVLQFSILTVIVSNISVPYNALIVAHEKMSAFAYISIIEVIARLLIAYLICIGDSNRLILYAILMFVAQLIVRFVYGVYCKKHFPETKGKISTDLTLIKKMAGFSVWHLWGGMASIVMTQGVNILLNMFFGPMVNAARGVAFQVQHAVMQFSVNFQMAINPQIIKSYATGDLKYMHQLIFQSSRFTAYLLLIICFPILFTTSDILSFWLVDVPDYTVEFLQIILISSIIDAVSNPLMVAANASGKIKIYQSVIGLLLLFNLPISYFVLHKGGSPISVFLVLVTISSIAYIARLFIIRKLIHLSLRIYFLKVVSRTFIFVLFSVVGLYCIKVYVLQPSSYKLFIMLAVSLIYPLSLCYYVGLEKTERQFLQQKLSNVLRQKRND